jgi:predicted nucleic acid-binding protein
LIFVDSNVPMYLVGAPHPHKRDAQRLLEGAVAANERLVTDVEVLQEILHRYVAIQRRDAIQPAFDAVRELVDEIFSVTVEDVLRAKDIVLGKPRLSARDAQHAAVMEHHHVRRILTFDTAFDDVPGLTRIS